MKGFKFQFNIKSFFNILTGWVILGLLIYILMILDIGPIRKVYYWVPPNNYSGYFVSNDDVSLTMYFLPDTKLLFHYWDVNYGYQEIVLSSYAINSMKMRNDSVHVTFTIEDKHKIGDFETLFPEISKKGYIIMSTNDTGMILESFDNINFEKMGLLQNIYYIKFKFDDTATINHKKIVKNLLFKLRFEEDVKRVLQQ